MKISSPLTLLGALGLLSAPAAALAQGADTAAWTCSQCPFPDGSSGEVQAGIITVSGASQAFGDRTGLHKRGAYLDLGGTLSYRGESGDSRLWAEARAQDLGLALRSLQAEGGREGVFALKLGYGESTRRFGDGMQTPFLGSGSSSLGLPAGYPAASTGTMPLASTLRPVNADFSSQRWTLGGTWWGPDRLTFEAQLRRDVRDGSRRGSVSFFANAAELILPVDEVTDQFELAAHYRAERWQAKLSYLLSSFHNAVDAVTVANPFNAVNGDTQARLAQAPDNQFHQWGASGAYQLLPNLRASADVAWGRSTQNQSYLPATSNATLAVAALPRASFNGRVDTFDATVRVSAEPAPGLRVVGTWARQVHDNRSPIDAYTGVAADMFVSPSARSNTPFSFWQDRWKLQADWRGPHSLRLAAGIEQDLRERSYSEVVNTRETSAWGRATLQPREGLTVALKLSGADRSHSTYGTATWFGSTENPLLRKFNLAARQRNAAGLRVDWAATEAVALGLSIDQAEDDYHRSAVGLRHARSQSLGLDASAKLAEHTQLSAFAQTEDIRSRQIGSQTAAAPDWWARIRDRMEVVGLGLKHAAIPDKLDLGADLSWARATTALSVQTGVMEPDFPRATLAHDRIKLYADYRMNERMTLQASLWWDDYRSTDWRLDGVAPASVANLLSLGQLAPQWRATVARVSMRWRF